MFSSRSADSEITIVSSKKDGKAVYKYGSFVLSGSQSNTEKSSFVFKNIVFDGSILTKELTPDDFDLQWSEEEQKDLLAQPLKAQYAIQFKGNVDASFFECEFRNYTHEYGLVMSIHCGD